MQFRCEEGPSFFFQTQKQKKALLATLKRTQAQLASTAVICCRRSYHCRKARMSLTAAAQQSFPGNRH